jgi:hypothetical protein
MLHRDIITLGFGVYAKYRNAFCGQNLLDFEGLMLRTICPKETPLY